MNRDEVMAWVAAYESLWRSGDAAGLDRLFTPDLAYRRSPYEPSETLAQIAAAWAEDEGTTFTMTAEPVAVDGRTAVVRVQVDYRNPEHEYRDLWLLRFAADGRVEDFEEWAYWPGLHYTQG